MVSLTDSVRNRQNKTFYELRPVVQELEKASREALNTWKQFTAAMESVGRLYDQYASLAPHRGKTDELGLDKSSAVPTEARKVCNMYEDITTVWVVSVEVVDMRALFFKKWSVWRRAENEMAEMQYYASVLHQRMEKLIGWRKDFENRKEKITKTHTTATAIEARVRAMRAEIGHLQDSVKRRDATIANKFSSLLRKTLSADHLGPYKTGQALRDVGQCMAKAYRKFDKHEDVSSYRAADVQQTPTMGVPLDIDMAAQMRVQPASQERTEAEYGRGFAYVTHGSPTSDVDSGSDYITVGA